MAVNDKALVEKCIEDGDLVTLLRLPTSLDDFSEFSIVKSLQWILSVDEKKIEEATKDITSDEIKRRLFWPEDHVEAPFSERKCYIVFNQQFLQEEARAFPFDSVLSLARYIHLLLQWLPLDDNASRFLPSLKKVVGWLNALLDSHFHQLRLAEDSGEVISSLKQQVDIMAQWQLDSSILVGTMKELFKQYEEKQRSTDIGDYCIEVISF